MKYTIHKFCSLVSVVVLTSCFNAPPPAGTAEQALAARDQFNNGLTTIRDLRKEFSNVITRFIQVDVVDRILSEPPKLVTLEIYKAGIEESFGLYEETSPGIFTHTQGQSVVVVHYLNGINLTIDNISYYIDNRMSSYRLSITSDNRGIETPPAEKIDIHLLELRPDLTKIAPTLLSNGTSTTGTYAFSRDGTNLENYRIVRNLGKLEAVGLTISKAEQYRFEDLNAVQPTFWESLETVVYLKSSIPGVWWGFSATQAYKDPKVNFNIVMAANRQTLATDGLASFIAVPSMSEVTYEGARVADLAGGPYTCDMNDTFGVGEGKPINLTWLDDTKTVDTIFPSLKFPCSRTILSLLTQL